MVFQLTNGFYHLKQPIKYYYVLINGDLQICVLSRAWAVALKLRLSMKKIHMTTYQVILCLTNIAQLRITFCLHTLLEMRHGRDDLVCWWGIGWLDMLSYGFFSCLISILMPQLKLLTKHRFGGLHLSIHNNILLVVLSDKNH